MLVNKIVITVKKFSFIGDGKKKSSKGKQKASCYKTKDSSSDETDTGPAIDTDELVESDEDAGSSVTQEGMMHFWDTRTTLV